MRNPSNFGAVDEHRAQPCSLRWAGVGALLVAACFPIDDLDTYAAGSTARGDTPTPIVSNLPGPAENGPAPGGPAPSGPAPSSSAPVGAVGSERAPGEGATFQGMQPSSAASSGSECTASATCSASDDEPNDAGPETPEDVDAGPPLPPRPLACLADETLGPNGNCFVAVATLLAWPEARSTCQARGAGFDLTTIRGPADRDFLKTFPPREVWVGGSDLTLEGTWAWASDGFEFWRGEGEQGVPLNGAFAPWFDDEPNGEDSSDCLRVLVDGTWTDFECGEERASVCEGPQR